MTAEQNAFFAKTVPAAQYSQRSFGVPASITLAQAVLESGWGRSRLAVECNNYFGIKAAHNAAPDTYEEFHTAEFENGKKVVVLADFLRFPSVALGFGAHGRLLALAPRYRPAMALRNDPARFADALYTCGYSTNFFYSRSLIALVNEFDLTQYDREPEPPVQESVGSAAAQEKAA